MTTPTTPSAAPAPPSPSTRTVRIGLLGFGNIGTGLVNALNANGALMAQRGGGVRLELARIADPDTRRVRACQYDPAILTDNAPSVIDDPSIDVIVELIGGLEPARGFCERALRAGKHVVTANKAMLANFGPDLYAVAEQAGRKLLFEASVGGGIPVMRALELGLSANHVQGVFGILNGTCNYILTAMAEEHRAYDAVLAEAQAQGYAEPDPTFDVEGYDTAHKTAVLASLAFGQDVRYKDVYVEGISRIRPVDIENAAELGYVIKLLGIAKRDETDGRIEARVHPTLVPRTSQLASVRGVFNAVVVDGDLVGRTLFYGRGAGQAPTASAVLSDVLEAATLVAAGNAAPPPMRMGVVAGQKNLKPIGELRTSYYLRIGAVDKPGVMAELTGLLARHDISIRSVVQKKGTPDTESTAAHADILIVTHEARESDLQAALGEMSSSQATDRKPFVLRVEDNL